MGTLHEDLYIFSISRSVIVRIRNVPGQIIREHQNTYFMFNTFVSENRAVYEIMWKNIIEPGTPQVAIR
jgi:hypothetical protein